MFPLLVKYRWPCFLALCALLGLACAELATTLTEMRLNRQALSPSAAPVPARPLPVADPAAELAFILQYNLFDQESRTNIAPAFSLRPDAGAEGSTVRNFELVGTIVAGERSLAVLRSGQEIRSYALGEELPGGGTLEAVVRHEVKIRNTDHTLTMLAMVKGGKPSSGNAEPARGAVGQVGELRAAGENRWVIPREMAASIRDNLGEQLRLALMQPRIVEGRTDGFIIKKLSPGTLLAQMGLRRGDVLKRVNTMPIDSPEKALQILQQLREARQLNIDLERDGKPLTFAYAIE